MEQQTFKIIGGIIFGLVTLIGIIIIAFTITQNMNTIYSQVDPPVSTSTSQTILADNNSAQTLSQTPSSSLTTTTKNNSWLSFDGVNDYLYHSNTKFPLPKSNFTIIYWINSTEIVGNNTIWNYQRNTGSLNFAGVNTINGNITGCWINESDKGECTFGRAINNKGWYMVSLILYNNTGGGDGNLTLYLDNSIESSSVFHGIPYSPTQSIGNIVSCSLCGSLPFKGCVDEIRYYNRTLTSSEISEIYASGRVANKSLPSEGLVLWLPLNEDSGTDVHSFNQSNLA